MTSKISLEKLIQGGAHFGHQVRRWNPKMEEYLYGSQKNVHLFDLTKTKTCLENALTEIKKVTKEGKNILIVGTKKQIKDKVKDVANECGAFYVNERWLGGTLTNFEQIKKSTVRLEKMKESMATGVYEKYTKKEKLLLEREMRRLERYFSGIKEMDKIPDLLIIFDIRKEKGAVKEANFKGVETVAVVDTNCDPTLVDYPIPMNDDAKKALEYVLDLISEAIMEGKGKIVKAKEVKESVKTNEKPSTSVQSSEKTK
jgi:small subunit ribosomal protein S2